MALSAHDLPFSIEENRDAQPKVAMVPTKILNEKAIWGI